MTTLELTNEYNKLQEKKNNVKTHARKMYYERLQLKITSEIRKIKRNEKV